jgi:hypothetical protein
MAKPKTQKRSQAATKTINRIFKHLKAAAEWVQKNPIPSLAILIGLLLVSGAVSWTEVQTALLKLK